jgi:hypothetical protein
MTKRATFSQADIERVEAMVSEAERSFAKQPKAMWSDRTYLAPKDAAVLRRLLTGMLA